MLATFHIMHKVLFAKQIRTNNKELIFNNILFAK